VLAPLRRLIAKSNSHRDPWERLPYHPPPKSFGRGSMHPFPWYFEGESSVQVACVDDVCNWLIECEYVRDSDLFNETDFWQHPRTFERLRQGDCEDYALWAWRKLVELGVEAELVSGTWHRPDGDSGGHVWVRYRHHGREYILETVSRRRDAMIRAFEDAKAEYVPHAGVDHAFQRHAYSGYLRDAKREAR
jgi:hypothetical protein